MALLRAARPAARTAEPGARARRELVQVLGQRKLFQKALPGVMHACIFWGFLVLFPTIVEAMIAIVDDGRSLPLIGEAPWFLFLVDLFATLVMVGIAIAFYIRKVQRPDRFRGSHMEEADRILLAILGIVMTLLLWNASEDRARVDRPPERRARRERAVEPVRHRPADRDASSASSCGRTC